MNEMSSSKIACPDEVVRAGARLVAIRRKAMELELMIDAALPDIRDAIGHVCDNHGAKFVQAGTAITMLREIQTAPGRAMTAHDTLRLVLGECGIAEPTAEQILAVLSEPAQAAEKVKAPGYEPNSIR